MLDLTLIVSKFATALYKNAAPQSTALPFVSADVLHIRMCMMPGPIGVVVEEGEG